MRQGWSLSPILFVIAINVLSHKLNRDAVLNKFGLHPKCKEVVLTHLSFADDMVIFTDGEASSLRGIISTLKEFQRESGLAINLSKSALYMGGKTTSDLKNKASQLSLPLDTLPIRYLGLPLTTKSMTRAEYEPLVDRIRTRFLAWSNKSLSYAGRL